MWHFCSPLPVTTRFYKHSVTVQGPELVFDVCSTATTIVTGSQYYHLWGSHPYIGDSLRLGTKLAEFKLTEDLLVCVCTIYDILKIAT